MPNKIPYKNGSRAERAAARKYGLVPRAESSGYYDAAYPNGSKVQIKGALYERESGDPGVYRVWKEHLRTLADHRGSVVLVVTNPSNPERKVLRVTKRSPYDLLDAGEFRPTRQDSMKPLHEARIPWPDLVSL